MDKDEAKKMLDDMVESLQTLIKYETYIVSDFRQMHIGGGFVRKVASAMGWNINEQPYKYEGVEFSSEATEVWFTYRGIRFYELEGWRMIRDAGAD